MDPQQAAPDKKSDSPSSTEGERKHQEYEQHPGPVPRIETPKGTKTTYSWDFIPEAAKKDDPKDAPGDD